MTDTLPVAVVKDLGFPIGTAVLMVGFFFLVFKWIITKYDQQYKDHRDDIIRTQNTFAQVSRENSEAFKASIKASEEHQAQIIGHLNDLKKNTDLILDKVSKKK